MDIRINELLLDGTKFNDFRIDGVESLSCEKGYFIIKRKGGSILSLDAKLHSIANVWPDESDGEADKTLKTVIRGTPDGEKACQEFRTLQALYAFKSLGFEVIKGVLGEEIALNDKKNSMGCVIKNDCFYESENPSVWADINDEIKRYRRKIEDSKKRFFTISGDTLFEVMGGGVAVDISEFAKKPAPASKDLINGLFACDDVLQAYAYLGKKPTDEEKKDLADLTTELSESEFPFEEKEWDNTFLEAGGDWKKAKSIFSKNGWHVRGVSLKPVGSSITIAFSDENSNFWEHVEFESYKEWLISLGCYKYVNKACVDGKIVDSRD